jgi:hypothetical protein
MIPSNKKKRKKKVLVIRVDFRLGVTQGFLRFYFTFISSLLYKCTHSHFYRRIRFRIVLLLGNE